MKPPLSTQKRTMKKLLFLLPFIGLILLVCFSMKANERKQTINPVIGDVSFTLKFGHAPDAATDEDLRIKTHLEYVENLLRKKDVSNLSPALRESRFHLLDLLHDYCEAGIFPRNYDVTDNRTPCFIDKDGRICAVGYLVEKSAGRAAAETINRSHKYEKIFEMNDQLVDNWISTSGLSKEECAMIQPTYNFLPGAQENISTAYGVSSSILGGSNLALSTLNAVQLSKGAKNKTVAILGMATGVGQTILGLANFPKTNGFTETNTNGGRKTLSIVNIGLGTSTLILSTWNLIANRKPVDKKLSWNINSFETADNKLGMAFTLRRKL